MSAGTNAVVFSASDFCVILPDDLFSSDEGVNVISVLMLACDEAPKRE